MDAIKGIKTWFTDQRDFIYFFASYVGLCGHLHVSGWN